MPDLDPSTPSRPIVVPDSPVYTQIMTFLRDFGLAIGAMVTLLGALKKGDIGGAMTFIQSTEFLLPVGATLTACILLWRQFSARRAVKKLQTLEPYAPAGVAITATVAKQIAAHEPVDPLVGDPGSWPPPPARG